MKKTFRLMILMGFLVAGSLQAFTSNLVIFTESGDRFTLYLNGRAVTDFPVNNLKMQEIPVGTHNIRVAWQNASWTAFDATVTINQGTEITYNIAWDSRRNYSLEFVSEVALNYNPQRPNSQMTVTLDPNFAPGMANNTGVTGTSGTTGSGTQTNVDMTVSGTTTTTSTGFSTTMSTTGTGDPGPDEVGATVEIGVTGDPDVIMEDPEPEVIVVEEAPASLPDPLPGYTGPIGCDYPITQMDFDGIKNSIAAKSFEDSKVKLAKQALRDRCLLTSQVVQILNLFTFESSKLDFAKYAHAYTYDIGNYYKVNDVFTFESSIDELDEYIRNH